MQRERQAVKQLEGTARVAPTLRFGPFEVDLDRGEVRRAGQQLPVQELPLRVLSMLLERPGELVTREEMEARLWPAGVIVDFEHGINTAVKKLRRVLGDSPARPRWIETVPRRGYRFVGRLGGEPGGQVTPTSDRADAAARLRSMPFVGRELEREQLGLRLAAAARGQGSLVRLLGEAGIGKSRLLSELAERAREEGLQVLAGRCVEGHWAPAYAPFVEVVAEYVRSTDLPSLRSVAGEHVAVLARLVPALQERLPGRPDSSKLAPDEERDRVADAFVEIVRGAALRQPLFLALDDLQWADRASLQLVDRLARWAPETPLCIVAAVRHPDPDSSDALEAIAHLRHGPLCGPMRLAALPREQVADLLHSLAEHPVDEDFVAALHRETGGNPLLVREILSHLVEEGKIERAEGRWGSKATLEELALPASVREVVGRRVRRLSGPAQRLLESACVFPASFDFSIAASVAGLDEARALDALDEVLQADLVREGDEGDRYEFCHALVRHVLYAELSPSRRSRTHRRIAEALERGADGVAPTPGEIADHYLHSAELPGADAGVDHCLAAAAEAEKIAAHADAARFLRMALSLLRDDARRARVEARLGLALAWAGECLEAARVASSAGARLAAKEGPAAAADYLADAADALWWAAMDRRAWDLAEEGLRHAGSRRDLVWARLLSHALAGREAQDPVHPGVPRDDPARRELSSTVFAHPRALELDHHNELWRYAIFESREDVIRRAPGAAHFLGFWAGEYRTALTSLRTAVEAALGQRRAVRAAFLLCLAARLESALGDLEAAEVSRLRAETLAAGATSPLVALSLGAVRAEHALALGQGFEALLPGYEFAVRLDAPEIRWALPITRAGAACAYALLGREETALGHLQAARAAIAESPPWSANLPAAIHLAVGTLWTLGRADAGGALERSLREKVLAPDFRHPHSDARLSLARLCALGGRRDEAAAWFTESRRVLDAQGALPLRAIVDLDEARMRAGRDALEGDRAEAQRLLDAAARGFEAIGMPGWLRRAHALRAEIA